MQLVAGLAVCFGIIVAQAAAAPNIVVCISDDHGYWDSEVAGATGVRTPNMRRLAEAGVTMTHAFAASPSCAAEPRRLCSPDLCQPATGRCSITSRREPT